MPKSRQMTKLQRRIAEVITEHRLTTDRDNPLYTIDATVRAIEELLLEDLEQRKVKLIKR